MAGNEVIIDGVSLDRKGVVHVEPKLESALCDLAIALQSGGRPVDVEHVLAALVMACRAGELTSESRLDNLDTDQMAVLARYVEVVFRNHNGQVSEE